MMDNRVFNVNGKGDEYLGKVLEIAIQQETSNKEAVAGWKHSEKHGIILYWHCYENDGAFPFPNKLTAKEILPIVSSYLKGDLAKKVERNDWDADSDHDGSNGEGWRVYCEDWGHVDSSLYAICAIKPAFMWYGK